VTGGTRTLDSLTRGIFVRRHRGERFDQDAWLEAVTRELGDSARSQFRSVILEGKSIVPAPDAFGPCFTRKANGAGYEWIRLKEVPEATCRSW